MKEKITVAVIDKGGRGHVLVEKYAQSSRVGKILAFPGNDFMQATVDKPVLTFTDIGTTAIAQIIAMCQQEDVALVDVAQDNAVEVGLVDALTEAGIATIGPTHRAGEIEWSKSWSRNFMEKYGIRQPKFVAFHSAQEGVAYLHSHPHQAWYVKADGLAEGKGAFPAKDNQEAVAKIKELQKFGKSGKTFLLEEWIMGENGRLVEEFSAFALCDGNSFSMLGYAQDYKKALDNDQGSNTGGMGAVTPPPVIDRQISSQVEEIFDRTIAGLKKEGRQYQGILYLGGMIGAGNTVYVVEFNARWGDPEAQVLVPSILNDFTELSEAVNLGEIDTLNLKTDGKSRVVIAATAKGYPENYSQVKGKEIFGLEKAMKLPDIHMYGAGIKKAGQRWLVDGGRVFYIVGEGNTIVEARRKAYQAMSGIQIEGNNLHYRTDIAAKQAKLERR